MNFYIEIYLMELNSIFQTNLNFEIINPIESVNIKNIS